MDSTTSPIAGPTDTPLLKMTIGCGLEATVDRCGDREALAEVATGRRWTYQQLADDVNAVAKAMLDSGIQVGDRIGIWAVNCAAWAIVQYATAKIGAILVPLNPGYRAREAEYVLNQAGVRLLFATTAPGPSCLPAVGACRAVGLRRSPPGCHHMTRSISNTPPARQASRRG